MKFFIATHLMVGFVAAIAIDDLKSCSDSIVKACAVGSQHDIKCAADHGAFSIVEAPLQEYITLQLAMSYDYLLMATHFQSYQKERPGFAKLFNALSEEAWENSAKLIKHITKRGGKVEFNRSSSSKKHDVRLEVDELHAIGLALDYEKQLATEAVQLHSRISSADRKDRYDPMFSEFLQREFFEKQSDTIRILSGFVHDLAKILNGPYPELSMNLFDEYLQ